MKDYLVIIKIFTKTNQILRLCHPEHSEGSRAGNLRETSARSIDFSPFGFAAKADASSVDLKVRCAQDDINTKI